MEISFLLFKLAELKKILENNYFLYDKKVNNSTYSHRCILQPLARLDVYTHIGTHICVWGCTFIGDVALFETIGTKTQHGCPGDDLLLSSCLNTSEFLLLRLIN